MILLDWSCRESFHSLHYLNQQTVAREAFEILWIEYHSKKPSEIVSMINNFKREYKPAPIDQWILMGMPENNCYHKHLMYNVGIAKSRGDIVVLCDSDAIFPPTFIKTIQKSFQANKNIVLHLDEVRNANKKFYPFSYPSIQEVLGEGCANWTGRETVGLRDKKDFIHTRNYGACMAAKRSDLIAIGGADESFDYVGHVCGPYEMTFRMINFGMKELWHSSEFIYHVWHPGQSGDNNYVGPHDGRLISTTALSVLSSGRVAPLVENKAIEMLRKSEKCSEALLQEQLFDKSYAERLNGDQIKKGSHLRLWYNHDFIGPYKECNIIRYRDKFYGIPKYHKVNDLSKEDDNPIIIKESTIEAVKKKIDKHDVAWFSPQIIEAYKSYNIVKYGKRFYGIPQTFVGFDLPNSDERRSIAHLSGDSSDAVKKIIDNIDSSMYLPVLLGTYRGYNIVKYRGKLYGTEPGGGHVDFTQHIPLVSSDILFALTQEEIQALIDRKLSETDKKKGNEQFLSSGPHPFLEKGDLRPLSDGISYLLYGYKNYNIVRYNESYYALPHSAGRIDLNDENQREHPEIIKAENCSELHRCIDLNEKAKPVEYAGWLPIFRNFGNCGTHPQFASLNPPPQGYRFTYSIPNDSALSLKKRLRRKMELIITGISIALAALKLTILALLEGAKLGDILRFFRTRGLKSQLLLKSRQTLVFLTSVPYTFGQYPWVIEIEDPTSLLFPFVHNGQTALTNFHDSSYFQIFKKLIESEQCRGIITHIKSTAENLPKLFKNKKISKKITYVPLGMKLPETFHILQRDKKEISLLFNNSWHQDPRSFYLRGGLDMLSAFGKLRKKYKNIFLILRSSLPKLGSEYNEIIKGDNVEIIRKFLTKPDWEMLMKRSDIYLLPSDRIHVVSMLEAMSFGLPAVVSDGWGFEEYIQDRVNGMVVRGRYGKVVWMDHEIGMLRENYDLMEREDPVVVQGLVEAITTLIDDGDLREKIGKQARFDVETKYNLKNWNEGLKKAFDLALNPKRT